MSREPSDFSLVPQDLTQNKCRVVSIQQNNVFTPWKFLAEQVQRLREEK